MLFIFHKPGINFVLFVIPLLLFTFTEISYKIVNMIASKKYKKLTLFFIKYKYVILCYNILFFIYVTYATNYFNYHINQIKYYNYYYYIYKNHTSFFIQVIQVFTNLY